MIRSIAVRSSLASLEMLIVQYDCLYVGQKRQSYRWHRKMRNDTARKDEKKILKGFLSFAKNFRLIFFFAIKKHEKM